MNIATNRKAHRDFEVLESFECGIALKGCEVKSLREKRMILEDSFARIEEHQVVLYNAHISPYAQASYQNVEPARDRVLLLHRSQIEKLKSRVAQKGLTLVPLKAYFTNKGIAKIELGLCKGKRQFDRRDDIKRREVDRSMRRLLRNRRK